MKERLMIILEAGPGVPEWIHLLPLGTLNLIDDRGPLQVDQASLAVVLAAWQARGNDLVIDYEHQTLAGGEAPAAGWIKQLEARADGLWARVEWTDKASNYLANREYRYFSPVLSLDGEGRPTALHNAGLTNYPAINNLPPLVAKAREGREVVALQGSPEKAAQEARSKKYGIKVRPDGNVTKPGQWAQVPDEQWGDPVNYEYPMPDLAHCRNALSRWGDTSNQAPYSQPERAAIAKRITSRAQALGITTQQEVKAKMLTQLKGILGLSAEAQETDIIAAVETGLKQGTVLKGIITALGLKTEATPEQIGEAITALKGDQGKLTALATEVTALKDKEATRAAESLVDEAILAGKYAPGERDLAILDAKRDPEHFKKCVAARPKTIPIGDKLATLKDGDKGGDGEPGPEAPVDRRVAFKARKLAAEKKLDLAAATAQVLTDNPELNREYKRSYGIA